MALISLRQMLDHAAEHDYGGSAFNINNMEQGLAIMEAAKACDAPVIIQASRGARSYANDIMLARMIDALVDDETDELFGIVDPLGQRVRIGGESFWVIGVLAGTTGSNAADKAA